MANIIRKSRNKVSESLASINDFTSRQTISDILTSEANKAWRAKILLDRVTRPGPKDTSSQYKNTHNTELAPSEGKPSEGQIYKPFTQGSNPAVNDLFKTRLRDVIFSDSNYVTNMGISSRNVSKSADRSQLARVDAQKIRIYNFTASPVQYLELQTVPKDIEFQGDSTWAVIKSMGRNTPMYHFTGAESIIQMNVSWYCNDRSNPQEVVAKCRLLEAWTKANGYLSSPPVLKIQWGNSDLFKDQLFILTSATYKLSNWRASNKVWDPVSKTFTQPAGYNQNGPQMYPSTATQELIFRRVSARNLTYEDIIPKSWLEKTSGFEIQQENGK